MKLFSKSMLKSAMMSVAFAGAVTQVSAAEIIPHRGLWKHYTGSDVAENSVSSYVRAKNKGVEFVEIDLRIARIHDADRVIVFHDFYWDRGVKYNNNGDDWGHKKFINQNPTTHAITQIRHWLRLIIIN